jgi:hypothetical protein
LQEREFVGERALERGFAHIHARHWRWQRQYAYPTRSCSFDLWRMRWAMAHPCIGSSGDLATNHEIQRALYKIGSLRVA